MFTLEEIKRDAVLEASAFDMNWDKLEDPAEAEVLTKNLELGVKMLPELESLYTKLISGKSVVMPDAESSLSEEELEDAVYAVAEELYSAYVLATIKETYDQVNRIIALSGNMDM